MKVSKLDVLYKNLINKAVAGDPKATNEVIKLLRFFGGELSPPDEDQRAQQPESPEQFSARIREIYGLRAIPIKDDSAKEIVAEEAEVEGEIDET